MQRHPTDLLSLGFGVLFAVTGLVFLVSEATWLPSVQLRWLVPLLVVVVGLWLLASSMVPWTPRDGEEAGAAPEADEASEA